MSEQQINQSIVSRVASVPVVAYVSSFLGSLYSQAKERSVSFNNLSTCMESNFNKALESVSTIFNNESTMAYIRKTNEFLLNNFNLMVERYPVIETPAEDVIEAANAKKTQIIDQANAQYATASEKVQKQYESTKETANQKYANISEVVTEKVNQAKDQYNEKAAPVVADLKTRAEPIIDDIQERAAPVVAQIKEQAAPIVEAAQKQYSELTGSAPTVQE